MNSSNNQTILQYAKKYHEQNLPIFPVKVYKNSEGKAVKQPLVMKDWQKITASDEDFNSLAWDKANAIGLVTGIASGTIVLDLDLGSDITGKDIPITPSQKTGSGGRHYFFKYQSNRPYGNRAGILPHVDIRGDGGFVVIAPSHHPSGDYEWIIELGAEELAEIPEWLQELLDKTNKSGDGLFKKHDARLAFGAPEGERNESAAKVIGHILSRIHQNYWLDFGLGGLREWNKRNSPPLPDDELVRIFKSIAQRQYAKK